MKRYILNFLFSAILLQACNYNDELKTEVSVPIKDTIPPVITINGNENDTVCLGTLYMDRGASVMDTKNGAPLCSDIKVNIIGTVNSSLTGVYFLDYDASDEDGNHAATITRTVHVIENSASFLNSIYNVVCSCTASVKGLLTPTVTTDRYIAAVSPGLINRSFVLSALRIGPEKIMPFTSLNGNSINVNYYGREYHTASNASGVLSAAKKSFTIESIFYQWSPTIVYRCNNVYTNCNVDLEVNKNLTVGQ